MKKERGVLRNRANDAKKRLASGYWQGDKQEVGRFEMGEEQVGSCQIFSMVREEDELYDRVANLLEAGSVNPLSQILDHDYLNGLTERERERHVLTLSQRVRDCAQRWRMRA